MDDRKAVITRLKEWGGIYDSTDERMGEIKRLLQQIEDAADLGAIVMDAMPHGGTPGDPVLRAALAREKMYERMQKIWDEIAERNRRCAEMDSAINALPPHLIRVLTLYYRQGKTLTVQIPQIVHADERTVRRWHDDAVKRLSAFVRIKDV